MESTAEIITYDVSCYITFLFCFTNAVITLLCQFKIKLGYRARASVINKKRSGHSQLLLVIFSCCELIILCCL